jgi:hypothetical protein
MKQSRRVALLILLNRKMRERGSWCGETHIQKAAFFLQEMLGVDLGYEFVLYKHGPFSFELRDELVSMQADQLLELVPRAQGYGPTYSPTEFSEEFLERFPQTISRHLEEVEFVAGELGDKGVVELEKLATAFFITKRGPARDVERRSQRLIELKPHISLADARRATDQVDRLIERAELSFPGEAEEYTA